MYFWDVTHEININLSTLLKPQHKLLGLKQSLKHQSLQNQSYIIELKTINIIEEKVVAHA